MAARSNQPTTPDLVVLSLLAEAPMHGYQLNQELTRRNVREWAGISRAQVYYSLKKLSDRGWIVSADDGEPAAGPDRQRFRTAEEGETALQGALSRDEWATMRERPPFLTWLALSQHTPSGALNRVLERRHDFLHAALTETTEKLTLRREQADKSVLEQTQELMLELNLRVLVAELEWIELVQARRAYGLNETPSC